MSALPLTRPRGPGLWHEALLYEGTEEFVTRTAAFLRDGVEAGDAVLAAVGAERREPLREALGDAAGEVGFLDMDAVGRNPGRLISSWHDFVTANAGRMVRGIGEPAVSGRDADELAECEVLEALWNVAFAPYDVWVLCPYDVARLPEGSERALARTHPLLVRDGVSRPSDAYRPLSGTLPGGPLAEPAGVLAELPFGSLRGVRDAVGAHAAAAGLPRRRREDLVLAVSEIAGNSLRHGGGAGVLRVWRSPVAVVCEVRDSGRIADPLVGRLRPPAGTTGGRGVWIAHQLCDLVQLRSHEGGTTVRLHVRL